MKKHFAFLFAVAVVVTLALPAQAIYVSNCPQICTPTCPCSLQCTGPFGSTTCGAAGQACTPLSDTPEDSIFLSFDQKLAQLDTAEAAETSEESPEVTDEDAESTESTSEGEAEATESK